MQRWSNRSLALLFVLSLSSFIALRWDSGPWLRAEVDKVARQAGVGLQFRSLAFNGLSVRMDGVSLDLPGMSAPVTLDRLSVRPEWLHFMFGKPDGDVSILWHGQPLHFSVILQDRQAQFRIPDSGIPVSALQPLWQKALALPVKFAGDIHLRGDVSVALADGRPVKGKVDLEWRDARASMPGMPFALGSYHLQGNGKDGVWNFRVAGGDNAQLAGSGRLDASRPDFRAWTVQAQGRLSVRKGSMLAAVMGDKPMRFALSGPAMAPQWHLSSQ